MNNDDQQNDVFPEGFLIKDKSGKFKKIQDDKVTDFNITPTPKKEVPLTPTPGASVISSRKQSAPSVPTPPSPPPVTKPVAPPVPLPEPQLIPPIPITKKVSYQIDKEDEEEIKEHLEKLKKLKVDRESLSLDPTIQKVVNDNNLQFDSEIIKKRFFNAIESRLRNIRDSLETKDILKRAKKVGGLEIPEDKVDSILKQVDQEAAKVQGETAVKKKEVPKLAPRPIESTKKEIPQAPPEIFRPKPKPQPVLDPETYKEPQKPPDVPRPTPPKPVPPKPRVVPVVEEKITPPPPLAPKSFAPKPKEEPIMTFKEPDKMDAPPPTPSTPPSSGIPQMARRTVDSSKPQMIDIKQPPRAIGPIEEIQEISLKDFRRLAATPQEAIQRIIEKIDLLEEDSFEKRCMGVQAWKQSQVNKLYLAIGRESIDSDQSVAEIVSSHSRENKPTLSTDEFMAINDLNFNLKF